MKFNLQTLLLFLTLVALTTSIYLATRPEPLSFRQYLISTPGSEQWIRIGSYSFESSHELIEFDLFYFDSDQLPYTNNVGVTSYPNSFELYCVWRRGAGQWTHSALGCPGRTSFEQVLAVKKDEITLQLRPNFRVEISLDDKDWAEKMNELNELNKPYPCKLHFHERVTG
ncbi:MAG: hypothetical protein AAGA30_17595 [Planctomycetota bacterium]